MKALGSLALLAALQLPWVYFAAPAAADAVPLGSEFRVNTYTTGTQNVPAVAADGDGDFVVVWNGNSEIFAQRYNSAGTAVGTEFQVNTFTTGGQFLGPGAVAAGSDGNFVVTWDSLGGQDGDSDGVFGQRYASSGAAVGSEFQVNTYTTDSQRDSAVAVDSDGDFVVAWVSAGQDGDSGGVFAQRYASSGAAVGSEFQVNTYTTSSQRFAAVASDADGDFVVAWVSIGQDGDSGGVFAQRYASSGAAVGSEFQINTYTTSYQGARSVAADADGDFVVVWESAGQDGDSYGVFGQRYASSGAAVGSEFQANTYTTLAQVFPSVTVDSDGDFIVVWQDAVYPNTGPDGSFGGISGQCYASSGAPVGSEFRVNTYTTEEQGYPDVAINAGGDFVVVWESADQDGSAEGVFAQRYGVPSPGCPASPDLGCTGGFGKGLLIVKETVAGNEKLIVKLIKGPAVSQTAFGNPLVAGGTAYNLCIYDNGGGLVRQLDVDRAGDANCTGGSTQCWVPIGDDPPAGKGYKYKDQDLAADGVSQIALKGGDAGKSKILVKARGPAPPFPAGIPAALTAAGSVTVQLRADDVPACFTITLTAIKKQEADFFKAK